MVEDKQMMDEANQPQVDPSMQKKVEDYASILMTIMHGPETRDDVLEMLSSSPDPFITVPQAAITVNDIARQKIEKQQGKVDEATMLAASQYLVGDLIELGEAAGKFQVSPEDNAELYQDAVQMYIERGLKSGEIDPIELQLAGEQFMSTNQKVGGQYLAQEQGLGYEPSQGQMLNQFGKAREKQALARATELNAKKKKQNLNKTKEVVQKGAMVQGGQ